MQSKSYRSEPMTDYEYELAKKHWPEVYILAPNNIDHHGMFGQLMGCSRQRAKEICYMFQFKHQCHLFDYIKRERATSAQLCVRIRGMLKEKGERFVESVYQVMDKAELAAEALHRQRKAQKRGIKY